MMKQKSEVTMNEEAVSATPSKLKRGHWTTSSGNNNKKRGGALLTWPQLIIMACGGCCCGLGLWIRSPLLDDLAVMQQHGRHRGFLLPAPRRSIHHGQTIPTRPPATARQIPPNLPPPPSTGAGNETPTRTTTTTLALLYPPGLTGGYRNQAIRFFALVEYALQHNISQLYLPSLLWSTQLAVVDDDDDDVNNGGSSRNETTTGSRRRAAAAGRRRPRRRFWDPVPMEWIFDVDHWNGVANATGLLPILTDRLDGPTDCWVTTFDDAHAISTVDNQRNETTPGSSSVPLYYKYQNHTFNYLRHAAIRRGGPTALFANVTLPLLMNPAASQFTATRQTDYLDRVAHCRNPYVYGGGTKQGRLWKSGTHLTSPDHVVAAMYMALRPILTTTDLFPPRPYTAVHARVELDMLRHRCGRTMERRLRNIIDQAFYAVDGDKDESLSNENNNATVHNLFIAVDRDAMVDVATTETDGNNCAGKSNINRGCELQLIGRENVEYLDRLLRLPHVYAGGAEMLRDYYYRSPSTSSDGQHSTTPLPRGSLLESAVNFQIAVDADAFVGVERSSYSTDVLRTRYFTGRRTGNYRYTGTGHLERVDGLVQPHVDCKR